MISLGGGSFLNIKIREKVKESCISIWLNASVEVIYNRIEKSQNVRPLFSSIKNKQNLEVLLKERNLIYQEADFRIDIENYKKDYLINKILNKLNKFRA